MRRVFSLFSPQLGAVALFLLLAGSCGSAPSNVVTVSPGQSFVPQSIEVRVGGAIEFVSEAGDAHTVTADEQSLPEGADYFASGGFSSEKAARGDVAEGLITTGETYSVTFEIPGAYRYFCIPHESRGMTGVIVVTA